jgi:hypothetical protein
MGIHRFGAGASSWWPELNCPRGCVDEEHHPYRTPHNDKMLLDEIERRLREVIAIVDHKPLRGYSVLRAESRLSLYLDHSQGVEEALGRPHRWRLAGLERNRQCSSRTN